MTKTARLNRRIKQLKRRIAAAEKGSHSRGVIYFVDGAGPFDMPREGNNVVEIRRQDTPRVLTILRDQLKEVQDELAAG